MILHFISTAERFCYLHMIAVLSAIKCHDVTQIRFWVMDEPKGIYWEKIKPLVEVCTFQEPDLRALKNQTAQFKATHLKDYMEWNILAIHGGLFLDLDTISVKDSTHWSTNNKDLFVSLDVEDAVSNPFPYNNAVVMAKAESWIVKKIRYYSRSLMNQSEITWGLTGPILLSIMTEMSSGSATSPDHSVFCPFGGNEISQIYEENPKLELPPDTEIIHLYAKSSEMFEKVDATFVRNSESLLARTIRAILPISDWNVSEWDEQKYLLSRGQHYAGLFRAIRSHKPKIILEIGTSAGDTAVGMIRTAAKLVPDAEIVYWGVDLFENGSEEVWSEEFTGGYKPPKLGVVYDKIKRETWVKVKLIASNSNHLTAKDFHDMGTPNLIYIDGGHSLATIRHDWLLAEELAGPSTVIVFDDYFEEMPFIGCKQIVDAINPILYQVTISSELDDYAHSFGRLRTKLVTVTKNMVGLRGDIGPTGRINSPAATEHSDPAETTYHSWAKDIMNKVRSNDEK
ncbi:MAG: class I SAM-dependent methyltransferase [Candidatus Gracilibacteria bacterium]|nr:class I SAM-dependent methyltransferase [Candidatus Gracilibacteria bacterium]